MQFYLQYVESIDEYCLGFNKVETPLMFSSRAEAVAFCIDYARPDTFEIIDVTPENYHTLSDSGAFDYDPE